MRRGLFLGLIVAIFLLSMIAVQPVKAEWTDTVEIYQSNTPDDRIDVDSLGIVNWKIRWASNQIEIVKGIIIIRVIGTDVDKLLCANYWLDGWRTEYVSFEVVQLEFSVFSVDCSGITEFEQTAENVTIVWDRILIGGGYSAISEIDTTNLPGPNVLLGLLLVVVILYSSVSVVIMYNIFKS